MNPPDLNLATSSTAQLVPAGFAEKAMASLMQMHTELVAEKERRVQLYRTLMHKEQSLAELAMYVRVLEERLGQLELATAPQVPPATASAADPLDPAQAAPRPPEAAATPAAAMTEAPQARAAPRAPGDGWKVW